MHQFESDWRLIFFMNIDILEMPLDFGASKHGSDMGPSALRFAGLKEELIHLNHTIAEYYSPMNLSDDDKKQKGSAELRYLKPIIKANVQLAQAVEKSLNNKSFPLILGGDHSVVLGSLAGLSAWAKKQNKKIGVLYVDAHGDFNSSQTSPSGNIHGMCMASSCGYGDEELVNLYFDGVKIDAHNVCYIGCRDIDQKEAPLMKKAGVTVYTMTDIDKKGFHHVLEEMHNFFYQKVDCVHLSFDLDSIDPVFAPGTGISVPGGLTYREALLLMEEISSFDNLISADIVELNPILDVRNETALLTISLIKRLFGQKLYI